MTLTDLRALWRSNPKALTGFVLALAVTLFFAVRFISAFVYWHNPAHIHEPVKPWMTIGYVAKSWGLHGPEIDAMAGLPKPAGGHPFTIREIARQRGVPEADIIKLVEDAVAKLEAEAPKPGAASQTGTPPDAAKPDAATSADPGGSPQTTPAAP